MENNKLSPVEWLFERINLFCMFTDGIPDEWSEALEQAKKMEEETKSEIRSAFADYYVSEGCDCCRDGLRHTEAENKLASLLNPEPYEDGSGFNWYLYQKKNN